MKQLHIIKTGGNVVDDPALLEKFLGALSKTEGPKILVHGGGKLATSLAERLHVPQTLVEGRRITDGETLKIAVMVYAGIINKTIVAKLQALGHNAIGLSGADGNLLTSTLRIKGNIDYGFVGDVKKEGVNTSLLNELLQKDCVPVICAVTHDGKGSLLNTNADAVATVLAMAMNTLYDVSLTYCFEKNGVMEDPEDPDSLIPAIDEARYAELKSEGIVSKGMLPKMDNAFEALRDGVKQVRICHAAAFGDEAAGTNMIQQHAGTER